MYKITELREKEDKELLHLVSEIKGKLLALRFENATGRLQETHLINSAKKDIAMCFTVLKEREQGIVHLEKIHIINENNETKKNQPETGDNK